MTEILTDLIKRQHRIITGLNSLLQQFARVDHLLEVLLGYRLELRIQERHWAYFGSVLNDIHAVVFEELEEILEESLSEDELDALRLASVLVYGRPKLRPDMEGVWLVIEVLAVVDRNNVERAQRRAAALRKAGYPAVATAV